jgi:anion-transporting  ArsA/GET3 family ATPase
MDTILNKRVIFVAGKGGAGKTTITAALAMAAASQDRKVLVVETHENEALGSLFDHTGFTEKPTRLNSNIWGVRIDPKIVLEEYIRKYVTVPFVAYQIIHSRIFEHLAVATPGLKEVMTLSEIWRFEQKTDPSKKTPLYDLIIIDSPATGHGLSLLRVPSTLTSMLQTGPLVTQIRWVEDMLKDSTRSCLVLTALPEELPVNEALEFERKAENDLNMFVAAIIVNMVYPEIFSHNEVLAIERMNNSKPKKKHPFIEAAQKQIIRRKLQQSHIKRLITECERPVFQLPFYYTNHLDREQIKDIAEHIRTGLFKSFYDHIPC